MIPWWPRQKTTKTAYRPLQSAVRPDRQSRYEVDAIPQNTEIASSGPLINVKDIREEKPRFKREYETKLDQRAECLVTAQTFCGHRSFSGQLTQPNGRWVLFDPDRIADKILDSALVPLTEMFCQEVRKLDHLFIKSNPASFTDESGARWERIG